MNTVAEREIPVEILIASVEDERDTLDLVRYWRAVSRNKWRILALVAAVGILAAMFASGLPPVYRGTATILLEASKPKIVSIEEEDGAAASPEAAERRVNAPIPGVLLNQLHALNADRYRNKKYDYTPTKG